MTNLLAAFFLNLATRPRFDLVELVGDSGPVQISLLLPKIIPVGTSIEGTGEFENRSGESISAYLWLDEYSISATMYPVLKSLDRGVLPFAPPRVLRPGESFQVPISFSRWAPDWSTRSVYAFDLTYTDVSTKISPRIEIRFPRLFMCLDPGGKTYSLHLRKLVEPVKVREHLTGQDYASIAYTIKD